MKIGISTIMLCAVIVIGTGTIPAAEGDIPIKGRELLERLVRLEEGQKLMLQRFAELREDVNIRFAELREDVNKRFEQVTNASSKWTNASSKWTNAEQMITLMLGIIALSLR